MQLAGLHDRLHLSESQLVNQAAALAHDREVWERERFELQAALLEKEEQRKKAWSAAVAKEAALVAAQVDARVLEEALLAREARVVELEGQV